MNLRPLSLDDRLSVTEYLRRFPPEISELTFTNLYAWRQTRPIWIDTFKKSLIIFAETRMGMVVLGNPVGPVSLSEVFREYGSRIMGVDRFPKEKLADLAMLPGIMIIEDRDNADYVYRREDLATLTGRNFTKKRNHINQCLATYNCQYEIITLETVPECLAMQDRWCAVRDCNNEPGLCGEYRAIKETLHHYTEFGLTGGAIRIEGTIEAFAIGEALTPATAVCHFEKAMPQFQGLGQLINQWFARNNLAGFTYVNREQDLGIPGLRRAKETYFPDHLVEKVRIVLSGSSMEKPNTQQVCG
ncbi:MAG: phosphatidylglycerol lysyltransferase domain-containing protein [Deltaproteobacteria bacterium]|nr:phosphatidylglycerol lysyltransferase domain-containing protein [Deltaproteobacteria bacterium]